MRRFLGAALVLGLLAVVSLAQDGPITIKVRKGEVGDVVKETKTDSFAMKMNISVMGMNQTKDENKQKKAVYTEEVLEKAADAKKPTKVKRTYQTADMTVEGKALDLGLVGKSVILETKDKKITATFDDGKALSAEQREFVGKEESSEKPTFDDVFLPKAPLKVGDTWKIDTEDVSKGFDGGFILDAAKSTATGKLVKVYDEGGRKFGTMEIKMDLTVTKIGGGGQQIPVKDGGKMTIDATLNFCIDGTAHAGTATLTMKADLEAEVMGAMLTVKMNGKNTQAAEPVKK